MKMTYTKEEVLEFIRQDDVKFIRLAFCDINGKQKNIAILPGELERAFEEGVCFEPSSIDGFENEALSDLFLFPIPSTLTVLPWRSLSGKVVRMFCEIRNADGTISQNDSRPLLARAEKAAKEKNLKIEIGSEVEFYLFKTDEKGEPTKIPFDNASYMDVAPEDRGENIRREICQTLMQMDIVPESSHHEDGPGQNEIDFRHSSPVRAADNVMNFETVVKAVAQKSGLYADFSPKPLADKGGNGFHINISVRSADKKPYADEDAEIRVQFMAGIINHIKEITAFLNPTEESYKRFGTKKAPKYISWSYENGSQLIRVPKVNNPERSRMELRSADPTANPYLAFALLIYAGLDGIEKKMGPVKPMTEKEILEGGDKLKIEKLPSSLKEAKEIAQKSEFVNQIINNR